MLYIIPISYDPRGILLLYAVCKYKSFKFLSKERRLRQPTLEPGTHHIIDNMQSLSLTARRVEGRPDWLERKQITLNPNWKTAD
jgi:hypothetical protein